MTARAGAINNSAIEAVNKSTARLIVFSEVAAFARRRMQISGAPLTQVAATAIPERLSTAWMYERSADQASA
jgi:hypothetical protein